MLRAERLVLYLGTSGFAMYIDVDTARLQVPGRPFTRWVRWAIVARMLFAIRYLSRKLDDFGHPLSKEGSAPKTLLGTGKVAYHAVSNNHQMC